MDGETPSSLLIPSEVSDEASRVALKLSPVPDNDIDVTPTIKNHKKTVRFNNEIETIQDETNNITDDSEQMLDNTIISTNLEVDPSGYSTMALEYSCPSTTKEESMALLETPEAKTCEVEDSVAGDVPTTAMEDPTRLSPLFLTSTFVNNNSSVEEPATKVTAIASLDVTNPDLSPFSNGTSATYNASMPEPLNKPSESLDENNDDRVSATIESSQIPHHSITQYSANMASASSSPSVFQEAIECLAESNLIYLLADLRWLSATGRIFTKYEAINIDSDFVAKDSAASLTASPSATWPVGARKGISPAQTIAVLLVELRKEFKEMIIEKNDDGNKVKSPEEENTLPTNEKSLFSSMVDPSGRKESTRKLHVSMKAYSEMIGRDLNKKAPEITVESLREEILPKNNGKMESLVEESPPKNNGEAFLATMQSFITRQKKSMKNLMSNGRPDMHSFAGENMTEEDERTKVAAARERFKLGSRSLSDPIKSPTSKRPTLQPDNKSFVMGSFKEHRLSIIHNVQEMAEKVPPLTEEGKRKQMLSNLVNDFFGVGTYSKGDSSTASCTLTEEELLDFMERAVESRAHEDFQFMADFFKESTISRAMVQSKSEAVWLNDWYQHKDVIYSISIEREKKRVLVVFRGCTTAADWGHSVDYKLHKTVNPVKEDFKGKKEFIKLHRGFFLYLFRRRNDTGTCKYDEIASVVDRYGRLIGDDYRVVATGHSLGGAMATIFSFYASTEERFTRNGPVKCITFGCPMVGGQAYADSFRYQERKRKLMLARFYNSKDVFARMPVNFRFSSRGALFLQTGVGIRLSSTSSKVIYVSSERRTKSYVRALKSNFLFHMPLPWKIADMHELQSHHKRILKQKGSERSLEDLYDVLVENELQNESEKEQFAIDSPRRECYHSYI